MLSPAQRGGHGERHAGGGVRRRTTTITNAAREPEIVDLQGFLRGYRGRRCTGRAAR